MSKLPMKIKERKTTVKVSERSCVLPEMKQPLNSRQTTIDYCRKSTHDVGTKLLNLGKKSSYDFECFGMLVTF